MSTHEAKPSHRAKSGRRRGLMGMALALLMLLPTLAISSASAAPTSAAARASDRLARLCQPVQLLVAGGHPVQGRKPLV